MTNRRGQPYLRGPYPTQFRASRVNDRQDVTGDVIELPTSDAARATRILKERRLTDHEMAFDEAVKKFRHSDKGESE